MSLSDRRRFKSDWLVRKIVENGKLDLGYKKDLLLAEFCHFFGCSSVLAPKFLKELNILGYIFIKDNICYSKEHWERMK